MKKIIFWNIKSKPKERKFQFEEGIGCYKLSTIAKEHGYETIVYQDHSFNSSAQLINDITCLEGLSPNTDIIAYSLLSNGVPLLEKIIADGFPRRVPVLIGGPGASIEPEYVLKMFKGLPSPIALVQGEAESVFERILETAPANWNTLENIWGINQDGKIQKGKYLTLDNMDLSPFADLSSSHQRAESARESRQGDNSKQERLEFLKSLTISQIESRRGCVHKCGFCNQSCLPTRGIRRSSPERLVSEMENMFNKYGITFFSLADNVAFDISDWWKEFSGLLESSPITPYIQFGGYSTPSVMNNPNWLKQTLPRLYEVGLRGIILGVQAGSRRILKDIINRPEDDPENALEITRQAVPLGINMKIDFIVGHPTETMEDLQDTSNVINKLYESGGEVFVRKLGIVPHSVYALKLGTGEYSLPNETPEFQAQVNAIIEMDGKDDNYMKMAFRNNKVPNKYIIDRKLGIVYPSTHFDEQTLIGNLKRLKESEMPEPVKERYQAMFELAIKLRERNQ